MARTLPALLAAAAVASTLAACATGGPATGAAPAETVTVTAAAAAAQAYNAPADTTDHDLVTSCATVGPLVLAYRDGVVPADGAGWTVTSLQEMTTAIQSTTTNVQSGMTVPNDQVLTAVQAAMHAAAGFSTDMAEPVKLDADTAGMNVNLAVLDRLCP